MLPFAIFFQFFPWTPRRVHSAAHSGYGGSPNGSHELGKIRKSIPLALCVHMFITLATPLNYVTVCQKGYLTSSGLHVLVKDNVT